MLRAQAIASLLASARLALGTSPDVVGMVALAGCLFVQYTAKPEVPMLDAFIPAYAARGIVYLHPINMRWGATKLRAFCREVVGIEPDYATAFVFTNRSRDCLLMYSLDSFDGQTLQKKLDKGAFLLPAAPEGGAPYVTMKPKMLSRLFRS